MTNKVKITQKEFDDIYEIEEITGESPTDLTSTSDNDTTPEFLTEEEEEHDKILFETLEMPEEEKDV